MSAAAHIRTLVHRRDARWNERCAAAGRAANPPGINRRTHSRWLQ